MHPPYLTITFLLTLVLTALAAAPEGALPDPAVVRRQIDLADKQGEPSPLILIAETD